MVGDDGEAIALERGAERIGEPGEILPMQAKRDGLNGQAQSIVQPIMRDSPADEAALERSHAPQGLGTFQLGAAFGDFVVVLDLASAPGLERWRVKGGGPRG